MSEATIESVSRETRIFEPPEEFAKKAHLRSDEYEAMYARSLEDPEGFWREQAERLDWFEKPTQMLDWQPPNAKWFADGKLNVSHNCLDRHVAAGLGDRRALVWEGEPGDTRTLTYRELLEETRRFASALKSLGVEPGDRVAIYMGMVPEAAVAMLACTRIGAVHTVIFGGFAADAIRDRVNDAGVKVVLTQDGIYRRGNVVPLKPQVDKAVVQCPSVKHTVTLRRTNTEIEMKKGRDHDWQTLVESASPECEATPLQAEHPLFILYTSGTTGKPKGVFHTTAGYLLGVTLSSHYVFDLRPDDLYWCTADIGWVTGHSYLVYGPLSNGASVLMYEGAPNHPGPDRFWELVEKHRATILYTAPTAIRAFIKWGDEHVKKHDLRSLRLLGTVGEPINPEAWIWYRDVIGGGRCPIVDTYWQTETGGMMITPVPGAVAAKPGSCTKPFFGVHAKIFREDGSEAGPGEGGLLVIDRPWPSMMRGVWGDPDRFEQTYFSRFPGKYFTGDGARVDKDGYYWVMGRVDDVVNVSGHRLGTAEVESALVSHPKVAEAAVVGRPDEMKGQALVAFVTLKGNVKGSPELNRELIDHVGMEIGKFAKPDVVRFADGLPKTRSGKIMRRLLRELAEGHQPQGDVTTLEDMSVLASLKQGQDE